MLRRHEDIFVVEEKLLVFLGARCAMVFSDAIHVAAVHITTRTLERGELGSIS